MIKYSETGMTSTEPRFETGLVPEIGGETRIDISGWGCPPGKSLVWLEVEDYAWCDGWPPNAKVVLTPDEAREIARDLNAAADAAEKES